jgi:hypothetical protein
MLFSFFVSAPSLNIQSVSEESTKKMAQQRACQMFLKKLFPVGTTWNSMIAIIQNQKDRTVLDEIVRRHQDQKVENKEAEPAEVEMTAEAE